MGKKSTRPKRKTAKRWGVQNVSEVKRSARDGTIYTEYRLPYWAWVPVLDDQKAIIGFDKKRLVAASSVSPSEARQKAADSSKAYEEQLENYWKKEQRKRGLIGPDPLPPVEVEPRRVNLLYCAEEMMRSRVRFQDGELSGVRFSYELKQQSYLTILKAWSLSTQPMDSLMLAMVSDWFINAYLKGHSESTAARFKDWLVQVGEWGKSNRYWQDNLFSLLPALSKSSRVSASRVYTLDEIDLIWDAARTPQEKALLVLLRCGLRQGECLALCDDHIADKSTINVQYTLGREKNTWQDRLPTGLVPATVTFLGRPKTKQSQGKVHIPEVWMPLVQESAALSTLSFVRAYDDDKRNGGRPQGRRFVLPNRYGQVWIEWCASKCLRRIMDRAGVELGTGNSTFHVWRHTFCSDLVALGCNDIELAFLMRHADFNLSKAVYASAREEHLNLYRKYKQSIKKPQDFVNAIAKFDEDRRKAKASSKVILGQ